MRIGARIAPKLQALVGPTVGLSPDSSSYFGANRPNKLAVIWIQSNAVGDGEAAAYELVRPGITDPFAAVQLRRRVANNITLSGTPPNISWVSMGPHAVQPSTTFVGVNFPIGSAGIELSLARALEELDPGLWRILIMAVNGSSFHVVWNDSGRTVTFVSPSMLDQLEEQIDAAIVDWDANFALNIPLGGESDSGSAPAVAAWTTNHSFVIDRFKARYGPQLKTVIPVLSYHSNAGGSVSSIISRTHDLASTRTDVGLVNNNERSLNSGDSVHYDEAGYLGIGDDIVPVFRDLRDDVTPAHPRVTWGIPTAVNSSTNASPAIPAHQANDIILICHFSNGQNAYAAPSGGWASVTNSPQHDSGGGANARVSVFWLRATSSATPTPTVNDVASNGGSLAVCAVIRGCKATGNPFITSAGAVAASGTALSMPTVDTTGTNNCLILALAAVTYNATSVAQARGATNASLTKVAEEFDVFSTTSSAGGVVLSGVKATGGAVDAFTTTLSNAGTHAKLTIAFAPP
jgi:hypothetical protein